MELRGTIEGIELQHGNKAQYNVQSEVQTPGVGYCHLWFTAERGLYDLDDKVTITVKGADER